MVEKHIILDMNDSGYDELAQVLGNKTAKKMVNLLAEKDMSEADISKELKLPINTIEYNLKKLVKVGLIETARNFFWSVKGKKIKIYKLANKKIIISTRKSFKTLLISVFGVGILAGIIKIASNSFVFQNAKKISDNFVPLEKASAGIASAPTVISTAPSIFSNVLLWFVVGCSLGLIGYLIYKYYRKMKGGKLK